MSHYQRHGLLPIVEPQSSLNLTPSRGNYRYPAVPGYSALPHTERFQFRQPSGYPLPWTFHPQYGEQHQQAEPVNHSSNPNRHLGFRPQSGPHKQLYPMPSPTAGSAVHLEVGSARTVSIVSSHASSSPDSNTKDHKDGILQHPLFPLLRLLLEKLEEATLTAVTPSPEEINTELENLVRLIQQSSSSVSTSRPDIDDLMVQAVTVLRLHLFELEKVNELCRDFCDRYTACLRKNLHTDQILKADYFEMDEPPNGHPRAVSRASSTARSFTLPVSMSSHSAAVYDLMPASQGLLAQPIHMVMPNSSLSNHLEEDLSLSRDLLSPGSGGGSMYDDSEKYDHEEEDSSSPAAGGKMSRRGILPKDAINMMKTWLFQHIMHPYPTEDEKRVLAGQTRLSLLQVNNWFINARRRILQPMLDASNPGGHRPKKGMQSRPVDPFWTGSATGSTQNVSAPGSQKSIAQEDHHEESKTGSEDEDAVDPDDKNKKGNE